MASHPLPLVCPPSHRQSALSPWLLVFAKPELLYHSRSGNGTAKRREKTLNIHMHPAQCFAPPYFLPGTLGTISFQDLLSEATLGPTPTLFPLPPEGTCLSSQESQILGK